MLREKQKNERLCKRATGGRKHEAKGAREQSIDIEENRMVRGWMNESKLPKPSRTADPLRIGRIGTGTGKAQSNAPAAFGRICNKTDDALGQPMETAGTRRGQTKTKEKGSK